MTDDRPTIEGPVADPKLVGRGVTDLKVFQCTGCHGWHVGRNWALKKLRERQQRMTL